VLRRDILHENAPSRCAHVKQVVSNWGGKGELTEDQGRGKVKITEKNK